MRNKKILRDSSSDGIQTLMKATSLDSTSSSSSSLSFLSSIKKEINQHKILCFTKNRNTPDKSEEKTKEIHNTTNKLIIVLFNNEMINWKILLVFGLVLWVTLCISENLNPKILSQEFDDNDISLIDKSINMTNNFDYNYLIVFKWFRNFYNNIFSIITTYNSTEAYLFSIFIGIIIYIDLKHRRDINKVQNSFTQYSNDLIIKASSSFKSIHDNESSNQLDNNETLPNEIIKKISHESNNLSVNNNVNLTHSTFKSEIVKPNSEICTKKDSDRLIKTFKCSCDNINEPVRSIESYNKEINQIRKSKKKKSKRKVCEENYENQSYIDDSDATNLSRKKLINGFREPILIKKHSISSSPAFKQFMKKYSANSLNQSTKL